MAAHDLREPLRAIRLGARLLGPKAAWPPTKTRTRHAIRVDGAQLAGDVDSRYRRVLL